MLECTDINYFYGKTQRLKNISFNVRTGSFMGLFGHNGSGKTTLLKILGGSLPVSFGRLSYFGQPALDARGFLRHANRSRIGVLFQETSSDDKLSSWQNLAFFARLMGIDKKKIPRIVEQTLLQANLHDRAHEPVKKLSGGMRRRLELYRSFMHGPKIVFLDEPTTGLDPHETQRFLSFAKSYCTSGASIIFSSHRAEELMDCSRVILLKDGSVLADEDPEQLVSKLDYIRCTIVLNASSTHSFAPLFALEIEGQEKKAKLRRADMDAFLQSPLLRDKTVKGFSLHNPSLFDAYVDLMSSTEGPSC